jgi:hypothetical protein
MGRGGKGGVGMLLVEFVAVVGRFRFLEGEPTLLLAPSLS